MSETPTDLSLTGGKCPSCGKPAAKAFRPFCSKRCADADLGRWLTGAYVVPGEPAPSGGSGDDA